MQATNEGKIRKITNLANDTANNNKINENNNTGKYYKLLKDSRKRSFTNITENTGNNNYSKHKENNKSSEHYRPKTTN